LLYSAITAKELSDAAAAASAVKTESSEEVTNSK
jgi:hypothetical protein